MNKVVRLDDAEGCQVGYVDWAREKGEEHWDGVKGMTENLDSLSVSIENQPHSLECC